MCLVILFVSVVCVLVVIIGLFPWLLCGFSCLRFVWVYFWLVVCFPFDFGVDCIIWLVW